MISALCMTYDGMYDSDYRAFRASRDEGAILITDPIDMPDSKLPEALQAFVRRNGWTYAKTMPEWPHHYLVRDKVDDEAVFQDLVELIYARGAWGKWYEVDRQYLAFGPHIYWCMGAPPAETVIINRCLREESYEHRARVGKLPG